MQNDASLSYKTFFVSFGQEKHQFEVSQDTSLVNLKNRIGSAFRLNTAPEILRRETSELAIDEKFYSELWEEETLHLSKLTK